MNQIAVALTVILIALPKPSELQMDCSVPTLQAYRQTIDNYLTQLAVQEHLMRNMNSKEMMVQQAYVILLARYLTAEISRTTTGETPLFPVASQIWKTISGDSCPETGIRRMAEDILYEHLKEEVASGHLTNDLLSGAESSTDILNRRSAVNLDASSILAKLKSTTSTVLAPSNGLFDSGRTLLMNAWNSGTAALHSSFNGIKNGIGSGLNRVNFLPYLFNVPGDLEDKVRRAKNCLREKLAEFGNYNVILGVDSAAKYLTELLTRNIWNSAYLPYVKILLEIASRTLPGFSQYRQIQAAWKIGQIIVKAATMYRDGSSVSSIGFQLAPEAAFAALSRRNLDGSTVIQDDKVTSSNIDRLYEIINSQEYPQLEKSQEKELIDSVSKMVDEITFGTPSEFVNRNQLIHSFVKIVKFFALHAYF